MGGSIELPSRGEKNKKSGSDWRIHSSQQAERKKERKKKLAIKQERIGFHHPNENSSCEMDESVWKHNSTLVIMRSYLRNWVYISQVEKKKKKKVKVTKILSKTQPLPRGISPPFFNLQIKHKDWLSFIVHTCQKKGCRNAVVITTSEQLHGWKLLNI